MANTMLAALAHERVLYSNSFAAVMTNCVYISDANGKSQSIISLSRITDIKRVKTSYPGLLVISSGLFLVAAAAFCSKDKTGADLAFAGLGLAFVVGFAATRRACVAFRIGSETRHTENGSLTEAAQLIVAVRSAQANAGPEIEEPERLAS